MKPPLNPAPSATPGGRFPFWLLPNLVSLDAPAVAFVWQRHLGAAFGVPVPPAASVGLAAIVWAVYLGDRVLDARAVPPPATDRHRFAARCARPFAVLAFLSGALGLGTAFVLPLSYFLAGVGVAVAVSGYLLVVHAATTVLNTRGWKELLVGGVFAAGVAVPLMAEAASPDWCPAVAAFGLCCCWNCRLIDRWEQRRATGRTAGRLIGLAAALLAVTAPPAAFVPLLAALLLLLLVDASVPAVGTRAARLLADAALLTPLPVWAFT